MTFTIPSLLLGILIGTLACWLRMRKRISDLKFDKEMLLDFNEKLIRDRDEIENKLKVQDGISECYARHLETHECRVRCSVLPDDTMIYEADEIEI